MFVLILQVAVKQEGEDLSDSIEAEDHSESIEVSVLFLFSTSQYKEIPADNICELYWIFLRF